AKGALHPKLGQVSPHLDDLRAGFALGMPSRCISLCVQNEVMPLVNILFWAFFASYVVHILDETLLNGGFVQWVKDNFWPTYHVRMFFWFNAAFLAAIAASNVLFDSFGGHWVILPLIFVAGFVTHAFTVHAYWSVRRNTYSPGLLTSTLYIVIFYLLIRYGL